MLVGLHDSRDEMVKATFLSLAELVDTLGGETVVGTPRSNIFADSIPRVSDRERQGVVHTPSERDGTTAAIPPAVSPISLPSPLHLPSLPSHEETRMQRATMMKEKRELQRQKKMAASSKLGTVHGMCVAVILVTLCGVGVASSEVNVQEAESEDLTTPTTHAQYSPSVSHDEEDRVATEIGGREEEGEEEEGEEGEEEFDEDWEEFTSDRVADGECEGESVEGEGVEGTVSREVELGWGVGGTLHSPSGVGKKVELPPNRSGGSLRLGGGGGREREERKKGERERENGEREREERKKGERERQERKKEQSGKVESWERARLSEEDRVRLEEQAAWSREPDFFEDMTPSVVKTIPPTWSGLHDNSVVTRKVSGTKSSSSSLLQYQPTETETEVSESVRYGNAIMGSLSAAVRYTIWVRIGTVVRYIRDGNAIMGSLSAAVRYTIWVRIGTVVRYATVMR